MKKKVFVILVLIVAFSFFIRTSGLAQNPPSLNWDEVSHGYNAYSIWKTGQDEWGVRLPLIFRAYGDYKLPLYIYLTAPLVGLAGMNSISVRFISVLSGVGLVIISFFLTKKLTNNEETSLLAAFLTAVSPWSLFLSRVAVEANLGALLFALGMYFFICWLKESRGKDITLGFIFWGLSLYSYNSARILVPLFFLLSLFLVFKRKFFKQLFFLIILMVIFLIPLVGQFTNASGRARFDLVSLIDQGTINKIIEKRANSKIPGVIRNLVFNRPTFFLYYASQNYLKNLSLKYLFFRGGSHYQFSLPDHELLYLVTAPFLLIGLLKLLLSKRSGEKILALWFFLAFIPSAITRDAPHVLRSILILPLPMILSALGLNQVTEMIQKRSSFKGCLLTGVLVIAVSVSFYRWWNDYQNIYPEAYSWSWQYGYKEVVNFVKGNYEKYNQIFFTKRCGEPHEFIAFFWPWDPSAYLKQKKWDYHANWYWVNSLDKFIFVNDWEIIDVVAKRQSPVPDGTEQSFKEARENWLLITSPGNYPEGWNKIKTIEYLDGKPSFEILEK